MILPLMNALYRFTQLTDSVTTFISFQHDSSCLHLLIHTGFLGLVIHMNQLYISRRDLTAILDHLKVRCTASLPCAAARSALETHNPRGACVTPARASAKETTVQHTLQL